MSARSFALDRSAGLDAAALAGGADRLLHSHLPADSVLDATLALLTWPGRTAAEPLRAAQAQVLVDARLPASGSSKASRVCLPTVPCGGAGPRRLRAAARPGARHAERRAAREDRSVDRGRGRPDRLRAEFLQVGVGCRGAASRRVKISELQLKADLAGNLVGHGAGSVGDLASNYWNQREAHLALSAMQRRSAEGGAATVELTFNGAYSAIGRRMPPALFDAMQRALARVAGGGAGVDLSSLLGAPDGAALDNKAFCRSVGFLLPIALAPGEFALFLEAPDASLQLAITRFGLRGLDAEYADRWGHSTPGVQLLELARGAGAQGADDTEVAREHFAAPSAAAAAREQHAGQRLRKARRGADGRRLTAVPQAVRVPAARSVCARDRGPARRLPRAGRDAGGRAERGPGSAQATAFEHLRRATDALERFSRASLMLIGSDEMVAWPFAAFAAAMAEAVGRPVPPGFVACEVLRGQEARAIPLIAA